VGAGASDCWWVQVSVYWWVHARVLCNSVRMGVCWLLGAGGCRQVYVCCWVYVGVMLSAAMQGKLHVCVMVHGCRCMWCMMWVCGGKVHAIWVQVRVMTDGCT
jgi:hypothetical protein